MKKLFALMLVLFMLPLTGLAESADTDAILMDASAIQVERMLKLARTDGYIEMNTGSGELADLLTEALDHDFSAPRSTLVVTVNDDLFATLMAAMTESEFDMTDPALMDALCHKTFGTLPTQLNAAQGATWLAATSIATTGDVLLLDGVTGGIAYVIRDYGDDAPLTCTSFHIKDGGLTATSTNLLRLADEVYAMLFDFDALTAELPAWLVEQLETGATYAIYGAE